MKKILLIICALFLIGCQNDSSSSSPGTSKEEKKEEPKKEEVTTKPVEEPDVWTNVTSLKDIKGVWEVQKGDVKYDLSIYNTTSLTFSFVYIPASKIDEYKYLKEYYGYNFNEEQNYYSKLILQDRLSSWARNLKINQKLNKLTNDEFGSDIILIKQNY